jgi:hypothetical protein
MWPGSLLRNSLVDLVQLCYSDGSCLSPEKTQRLLALGAAKRAIETSAECFLIKPGMNR